jgi:hypothetical protein
MGGKNQFRKYRGPGTAEAKAMYVNSLEKQGAEEVPFFPTPAMPTAKLKKRSSKNTRERPLTVLQL